MIRYAYLVPKASVQQMQHCVLLAAHIQVHREPALALLSEDLLAVLGVSEPQVVPATASPLLEKERENGVENR